MIAVRLNRKLRALGRRRVASWTLIAAKIDAVRADIDAAAAAERERVARSMRLADLPDPVARRVIGRIVRPTVSVVDRPAKVKPAPAPPVSQSPARPPRALINLSSVPSSMEARAAAWSKPYHEDA